jgi:hypothetical protein
MRVPKRTEFASKALDLAARFRLQVGSQPLAGAVAYRVELAAPDGLSTGGGTQSVQHIKLVPPDGGVTIVVGSADQKEGFAELRTYECVHEIHAQRFKGAALPLEPGPYNQLVQSMDRFFRHQGMRVVLLVAPLRARRSERIIAAVQPLLGPLGRGRSAMVSIGLLAGLAVGVAGYLLLRRV